MTDKITKFLARLSAKDLKKVQATVQLIIIGDFNSLNVLAIKGKPGYIRVRVGNIRIIARQVGNGYEIMHVTNRNEKTYKSF